MTDLLLALSLLVPAAQALCSVDDVPPDYRGCVEKLLQEPGRNDSYVCFYYSAKRTAWDEGLRMLRRCVGDDSGWSLMVRGHIARYRDDGARDFEHARELYSRSIQAFQAPDSNPVGEVLARVNLRDVCWDEFRDQACVDEQIAAMKKVAAASQDPRAIGWACVCEAEHLVDQGKLSRAYEILKKCREVVSMAEDSRLQGFFNTDYANVLEVLGRSPEAQDAYREQIETARSAGKKEDLPNPTYNLLRSLLVDLEWLPKDSPERLREIASLGEENLRIAEEVGYPRRNMVRTWLGGLLTRMGGPHAERGSELLRQAIRESRSRGESDIEYYAIWHLADYHLRNGRGQEARRLIERNRGLALKQWRYGAYFWQPRMRYALAFGDVEKAASILEEIEGLRALQQDPEHRMFVLTNWTEAYYWLAGQLLKKFKESGDRRLLERAFEVTERMRARVLLESLQGSRAAQELEREQKAFLERIEQINTELEEGGLTRERRALLLKEREGLEEERMRMRFEAILQGQPERPGFAKLSQVEGGLAPNQAVISWLLGLRTNAYGREDGGAWALVITSRGTSAMEIADRTWVHEQLPFLEGLIERRDESSDLVIGHFYERLLRLALEKVPAGVEELILAPDGELHRLPFPLLAENAGDPPIGQAYRLSFIPSVSLWRNWVDRPGRQAASTAIALADPVLNEQRVRDFKLDLPWQLRRLPYARSEGEAVRRLMGSTSRLAMGEEASEHFLEKVALEDYAVLHFAAHAVVDSRSPQRSAIMLAPGASDEDGILESREIVDMSLGDNLVVLSACQSASGTLMQGEGVVGLARAFFQAGARVVVGSLWPLRDDDAAFFFESFYSELGRGRSVSSALQASQKAAAERGLPPQAWAGIVALGDGNLVPFPEGVTPRPRIVPWWLIALALLLAAAFAAAFLLRRHPRAAPAS